jgi:hypothetical protein
VSILKFATTDNMKHINKITSLQQLIDWIDNSDYCTITETGEDHFIVETPNNADVYVRHAEYDENRRHCE